MIALPWILGCSDPSPAIRRPAETTDPIATGTVDDPETETDTDAPVPPCTPIPAVFFDLGETLVTERDDGLREEIAGASELLAALRAQRTSLGIITNVPSSWDLDDVRASLVDPTFLDGFDVVLPSSLAVADPKPDPAIYAEALALLPNPPPIEQVAFATEEWDALADGPDPTEGAQAAGMIGVLIAAEAVDWVDHTVADLPALAAAEWVACLEAE